MIALPDFLPYVLPYVTNCPAFVVQDAVLATIQDFYRRTREKAVELPAIDVIAGKGVYTLVSANAHIFEVQSALYDKKGLTAGDTDKLDDELGLDWRTRTGTPQYFYMPGLDEIRIALAPNLSLAGGLLVVGYSYPARTVDTFDDILLEEHRDTIVNGALSRLMLQQDQQWTDLQQGVARSLVYDALVASHRTRVSRGRVRSRKRIKGHYF